MNSRSQIGWSSGFNLNDTEWFYIINKLNKIDNMTNLDIVYH